MDINGCTPSTETFKRAAMEKIVNALHFKILATVQHLRLHNANADNQNTLKKCDTFANALQFQIGYSVQFASEYNKF